MRSNIYSPRKDATAMNARSLHDRFRTLVGHVVKARRGMSQRDWLVESFDDEKVFVSTFRSLPECNRYLNQLSAQVTSPDEIDAEIRRAEEEEGSYLEMEMLRYEFPDPAEESGAPPTGGSV